jgi:hypothetical protein
MSRSWKQSSVMEELWVVMEACYVSLHYCSPSKHHKWSFLCDEAGRDDDSKRKPGTIRQERAADLFTVAEKRKLFFSIL